jgi:phosphatidylinositol glycan class Q protein
MLVLGIDWTVGLLLGSFLAYCMYSETARDLFASLIEWHYRSLLKGVQWLEQFPIGFKLNERLTETLGKQIASAWLIHERAVAALASEWEHLQPLLASIFLLTGLGLSGSGLAALLFDASRVLTLHVSLFAACFRQVYLFELYLLAALWRVFRGKKQNKLRLRTDTLEYDSMQLLLGTILFAVALFLFTTIAVYHVFFSLLNLLSVLSSLSFMSLYILLTSLPWGNLLLRRKAPGWFTEEVFLQEIGRATGHQEDEFACVTRLVLQPEGYSGIAFRALTLPVRSMLIWPASLIVSSLLGSSPNEPPIDHV